MTRPCRRSDLPVKYRGELEGHSMPRKLREDLSSAEFKRVSDETTMLLQQHFAAIRNAKVFPGKKPSEIAKSLEEPLPVKPQDPVRIIREVRDKILPNSTQLGSPRYFGFVNGSGTMMSCFADEIAAAINPNTGIWKAAPAASEVERLVVRWLAEMIGYDTRCGGILESGGTMANVTAIATALHDKAGYDIVNEGLQSPQRTGKFVLYMSDHEGHSSVVKAAQLLGLGRNSVRRVKSRDDFTMDTGSLEEMINQDAQAGNRPFCVVGQVGSINVGVVDPLREIARVCNENDIWFHADGSVGAFGRIIPRKAHLFDGLELTDSVTLDPHKWLYVSYACGCVLVKDPEKLRKTFTLLSSYLRGILPTEYSGLDYLEYGPQMSRGFTALKLWMSIKQYGVEGYRKLLERNVELAEYFDGLVNASEEFEPMCKPVLQIYCFRYNPSRVRGPGLQIADLNRLNQMIVDETQLTGDAFMMTTSIRGNIAIRICITNHRTTRRDIDLTFATIRRVARRLAKDVIPSVQSL